MFYRNIINIKQNIICSPFWIKSCKFEEDPLILLQHLKLSLNGILWVVTSVCALKNLVHIQCLCVTPRATPSPPCPPPA